MEYQYSRIVDPSTYETEGLCDGIPVRSHCHAAYEEIGAKRAQEDWKKLVGPLGSYRGGCFAAKHSLLQISIPECLPERLEIISYANEIAFLHDDSLDEMSQDQANAENDRMLDAFQEVARNGSVKGGIKNGKEQLQANIFREMVAIDRERALTAINSWASFVQLASGRQHDSTFVTFEEYISYRILDVGEMFWFGMVTFGMAITIPEEEMDLCRQLTRSAYIASALQNDIFSLEKELEVSRRQGHKNVVNAVWLMMRDHSIPLNEAKELCKAKIRENVAEYLSIVESVKDNKLDISLDLRIYLDAMLYTISGNATWSIICPRYHYEPSSTNP